MANEPIHINLYRYEQNYGGHGFFAQEHSNFCDHHSISAGGHNRVTWVVVDQGRETMNGGTVYCSRVLEIHHNTTGPGSDGISLPCPPTEKPLSGSIGYHDAARLSSLTQVHGGFGHNSDGFWNYKFHNWNSSETARVQMWGICKDRG